MPTYEYACESCGNRHEKREGFDAKPRQKCPTCGRMAQRLLSTPAVVFKGSGFYKTDNRGSDGESTPSEAPPATPATPAVAADGHGHSHGPGGDSHDTASPAKPTPDTSTTTSEAAAAG